MTQDERRWQAALAICSHMAMPVPLGSDPVRARQWTEDTARQAVAMADSLIRELEATRPHYHHDAAHCNGRDHEPPRRPASVALGGPVSLDDAETCEPD